MSGAASMKSSIVIAHDIGRLVVKPSTFVDPDQLEVMIREFLDLCMVDIKSSSGGGSDDFDNDSGDSVERLPYHVGERLRRLRLGANLTQKELSGLTGIAQPHLSEIEHGKRMLGRDAARRLAHVFGMDYRSLL